MTIKEVADDTSTHVATSAPSVLSKLIDVDVDRPFKDAS